MTGTSADRGVVRSLLRRVETLLDPMVHVQVICGASGRGRQRRTLHFYFALTPVSLPIDTARTAKYSRPTNPLPTARTPLWLHIYCKSMGSIPT